MKTIHLTESLTLSWILQNQLQCRIQLYNVKGMAVINKFISMCLETFWKCWTLTKCLITVWLLWWCHGLILMLSLPFLSVCHHFPGSSRVHLCGWPEGTEGLSALSLGNLPTTCPSHIFSSIWIKWSCVEFVFPGCLWFGWPRRVGWRTGEARSSRIARNWTTGPTSEYIL